MHDFERMGLTGREKFEQQQREKENQAPEEDDPTENFSFEGNFVYTKMVAYTLGIVATGYFGNKKMASVLEERRNRYEKGISE